MGAFRTSEFRHPESFVDAVCMLEGLKRAGKELRARRDYTSIETIHKKISVWARS